MNSLKSACSFAKVTPMPFDEFQQHVQPLFWCQVSVKLIVGRIRFFKIAKDLADAVHAAEL